MPLRNGFDARLWLAPGVLLCTVELHEIINRLLVDVKIPTVIVVRASPGDLAPHPAGKAEFRLAHEGRGGEVVHYDLASWPPAGWRWLATNGILRAERVRTPTGLISWPFLPVV